MINEELQKKVAQAMFDHERESRGMRPMPLEEAIGEDHYMSMAEAALSALPALPVMPMPSEFISQWHKVTEWCAVNDETVEAQTAWGEVMDVFKAINKERNSEFVLVKRDVLNTMADGVSAAFEESPKWREKIAKAVRVYDPELNENDSLDNNQSGMSMR